MGAADQRLSSARDKGSNQYRRSRRLQEEWEDWEKGRNTSHIDILRAERESQRMGLGRQKRNISEASTRHLQARTRAEGKGMRVQIWAGATEAVGRGTLQRRKPRARWEEAAVRGAGVRRGRRRQLCSAPVPVGRPPAPGARAAAVTAAPPSCCRTGGSLQGCSAAPCRRSLRAPQLHNSRTALG